LGLVGTYHQDSKVEFTLPYSGVEKLDSSVNPFEIGIQVIFTGPSGQVYTVPAFYDGDGAGGQEGNIWKVRFYADSTGEWSFRSASEASQLDGYVGSFVMQESTSCQTEDKGELQPLTCLGTLKHASGHYLRFADGEYWIKGGVDDPENFLGDAFGNWNAKKDAVDFLSSKGVNSIYVITNNIDGDNHDTWPWMGATPNEAKKNSKKFNVNKLQLWENFFTYAENKGLVLHIVLNDDSAWNGYDHDLYFKEMVARFGHHPGLIWNIGEEANEIYSNEMQVDLGVKLRALDPYKHAITVHRTDPWPFLGNSDFDLTSMQTISGALDFSSEEIRFQNDIVIAHREDSAGACWPIPVMIDELPGVDVVNDSTRKKMRSDVLYPIFFGGGNYEMHYRDAYGSGGNVTLQILAPMLEDMSRARQFVESLPFNEMKPCNERVSGGGEYCFGLEGSIYAVYLPQGGQVTVNLSGVSGDFNAFWYDPLTGTTSSAGSVGGGGNQTFDAPGNQDWVLKLENSHLVNQSTPGLSFASLDEAAGLFAFKSYFPTVMQCGG
jgi:hypothetical protein